jgi:hypothetical protein
LPVFLGAQDYFFPKAIAPMGQITPHRLGLFLRFTQTNALGGRKRPWAVFGRQGIMEILGIFREVLIDKFWFIVAPAKKGPKAEVTPG